MLDFDFIAKRDEALTVACPFCRSLPGAPCMVRNYLGEVFELRNFPAHPARADAAITAKEADDD